MKVPDYALLLPVSAHDTDLRTMLLIQPRYCAPCRPGRAHITLPENFRTIAAETPTRGNGGLKNGESTRTGRRFDCVLSPGRGSELDAETHLTLASRQVLQIGAEGGCPAFQRLYGGGVATIEQVEHLE